MLFLIILFVILPALLIYICIQGIIENLFVIVAALVILVSFVVALVRRPKQALLVALGYVILFVVGIRLEKAHFAEKHQNTSQTVAVVENRLDVTVSGDDLTAGDTVSLKAEVTYNGKPLENLESAGLYLWWWTDVWAEGHGDGLLDAVYSDSSGRTLEMDVTLPSTGNYYICAELKDAEENLIDKVFIPIRTG